MTPDPNNVRMASYTQLTCSSFKALLSSKKMQIFNHDITPLILNPVIYQLNVRKLAVGKLALLAMQLDRSYWSIGMYTAILGFSGPGWWSNTAKGIRITIRRLSG